MLTKNHRGIQFQQSDWLQPYIAKNSILLTRRQVRDVEGVLETREQLYLRQDLGESGQEHLYPADARPSILGKELIQTTMSRHLDIQGTPRSSQYEEGDNADQLALLCRVP